jgi:hypothetical protein
MTPGDRLTSRAYLATRTRPLDGADALHWSPDTAVPDPPRLVASYHAVPLDPDGEPWAIDPDVYRRIHRSAITGRLARDPVDWERRLWSVLGYVPALIALLLVALFVYAAFREMAP